MLAPRMFSGSYGANITYNIPDRKNLAVPCNPLGDRNSVSDFFPEIHIHSGRLLFFCEARFPLIPEIHI